jgi:hypothetical protein
MRGRKLVFVIAAVLSLALMASPVWSQPVLSDIRVENIADTTAVISWRTDTYSDSRVNYGTTTALGQTKYDAANVTHHSLLLTDLTPDTLYYFRVESRDASGTTTSDLYSFKTIPRIKDTITLSPVTGVYNDAVEVTVNVRDAGTYYVCWRSTSEQNRLQVLKATKAESFTFRFRVPEAPRGIHRVYLTNSSYSVLDSADFEVFASIKIEPTKGPVGTEVAIRGYGFEANERDIEVSFREKVIMEALQADSLGSWLIFYSVPPTPSGDYLFEVRAERAAEECEYWQERFTVTPQIVINPTSAIVGRTIAVTGTGFAKEEGDIKVTFNGETIKKDILADKDGSWTATFTVPVCHSGRHTIDASGISTRARDVPDVTLVVSTGVSVEPDSVPVGARITVTGGAFPPGEGGIRITLDGEVIATGITADQNGGWQTTLTLPPTTHGSHTISAYGDITKASDVAAATITIQARIAVEPTQAGSGSTVKLSGSGFHGGETFTVKFDGATVLEGVGTDARGNFVTNFKVPPATTGEHTVTVTDASGATASAVFTVEPVAVGIPQPVFPQGTKLKSGEVTFQWQTVSGVAPVTYTLEVSSSPDFAALLRTRSGLSGSSYKLSPEEALPRGTYYWRVKAIDAVGTESQWSSASSFAVAPPRSKAWIWVLVGIVVAAIAVFVAYRATRFRISE